MVCRWMCMCVCVCVCKADGRGSVALQTRPLHWSCDSAGDLRLFRCSPNPDSEFCEVIGQILLHGVTVMLHWLVGDAGGEGEKQM